MTLRFSEHPHRRHRHRRCRLPRRRRHRCRPRLRRRCRSRRPCPCRRHHLRRMPRPRRLTHRLPMPAPLPPAPSPWSCVRAGAGFDGPGRRSGLAAARSPGHDDRPAADHLRPRRNPAARHLRTPARPATPGSPSRESCWGVVVDVLSRTGARAATRPGIAGRPGWHPADGAPAPASSETLRGL